MYHDQIAVVMYQDKMEVVMYHALDGSLDLYF